MDFEKIFIKNAKKTKIGGQAVMEGIMMQSDKNRVLAVRLPNSEIYLESTKQKERHGKNIPVIRGVVGLFDSMIIGTKALIRSEEILEENGESEYEERQINAKSKNLITGISIFISFLIAIGLFAIMPTFAIGFLKKFNLGIIGLNLIEGVFRLLLFLVYVLAISRLKDIRRTFEYHGAEHKTIHCFESGLPLNTENAKQFSTLHPRCGTSFLMFVVIVSLFLFSLCGWPNLTLRVLSRIVLLPIIAGLSYELLRLAGKSDGKLIKILSVPGLLLQKITTKEPSEEQLEVAISSLKKLIEEDNKCDNIKAKEIAETREEHQLDKENDRSQVIRFDKDPASVENALRRGRQVLSLIENGRNDAVEIFCYVMGFTHNDLIIRAKEILDDRDIIEYEKRIEKRLSGVPLQYIVGVQEFMGLPFRVNENVLIPRLDSEILAEQVIGILKAKDISEPKILDLCTGSGAIGISIAHEFRKAVVKLADISEKALETAIENAKLNGVFERCEFVRSDMFENIRNDEQFDIIISNPPYIPTAEIEKLSIEVKKHEPVIALDGGEDGLDYYRIIAEDAGRHLKNGGILALEIGSDQGKVVPMFLTKVGDYKNQAVIKDFQGLDRVVIAEKQ